MISAICPECEVRKEVVVHTNTLMCLTCNTEWRYADVKSSTLQPVGVSGSDESDERTAPPLPQTPDVSMYDMQE